MKFIEKALYLKKEGIEFGSFTSDLYLEKSFNFTLPAPATAKGTENSKDDSSDSSSNTYPPIFAHVYLTKSGQHPDPYRGKFDPTSTVYRRVNLIARMKRPRETNSLIAGYSNTSRKLDEGNASKSSPNANNEEDLVSYWYPEVNIGLLQDASLIDMTTLTLTMARAMSLTMDRKFYLPTLYTYEGWRLKDRRIVIDREATMREKITLPLKISFAPIGMLKLQLLTHFDHSFQVNESILGSDSEMEKLKQMFIDTNPYLLIATLIVSVIHSIFDFLAFKNDVQFWRKKDNFQGLSVRSVLISAVFQLIIFLYLLEQETSWLILISVGIGTLIELWKLTRVFEFKLSLQSGFVPIISISDRATYAKTRTQEYDSKAVRWLGMAAIPLLFGYAIYSLIYEKHRGWYSWVLSTMVGFVYTFGFVTMTPQLFINYKFKSVAHMPWRVFVYKALNTFIDDMFAFIIKMPTLHRLACFRDDIVFLIYLYQRWIYPVDKSRPNEYGQVYDDKEAPSDTDEGDVQIVNDKKSKTNTLRRTSLRVRHPQIS